MFCVSCSPIHVGDLTCWHSSRRASRASSLTAAALPRPPPPRALPTAARLEPGSENALTLPSSLPRRAMAAGLLVGAAEAGHATPNALDGVGWNGR